MITRVVYPQPIQDLIERFRQLPGVGPKTAERYAVHYFRTSADEAAALARTLLQLRDRVQRCTPCGMFAEREVCVICADPRRDRGLLAIVAEAADLLAVERTGGFRGVYHILGGLLAPIEGIGPEQLRINELVERVQQRDTPTSERPEHTREIIFALDPTIEGETTLNYLVRLLTPIGIPMSRIARGLPVGGDLEYADPVTLTDALNGRRPLTIASRSPEVNQRARTSTGDIAPPF